MVWSFYDIPHTVSISFLCLFFFNFIIIDFVWYKISVSSLIPHILSSAWPSLLVSLFLSWVFKLGYWVSHFHLHFSLSFHQYSLHWIWFYNSRLSLVFHSVHIFVYLGIPQVFVLFKLIVGVYWVILLCLFKVLELFHEIFVFSFNFSLSWDWYRLFSLENISIEW